MLEIKNLTKVYRSKTGEEVRALDNVSISFPESGMVFILGKSGSGKSTLLNIMGGLDSYDSGEFVIKGKSSKDFAGSDFDAYRNTFIGFIFQEYNVLDDFTVGANIGLALELQGKKATSERISEILSQVDLLHYAKRKPNELSGGQKQRVAIARALVKDPQIIMADEPTGALDSTTGKQIFDTLKQLSREKLVLVVSHDRDFAERYADRIIELSDGRILSDVTKHEHESEKVSEGIDRISPRILRIKRGYKLTASDLQMINEYLEAGAGDVILSNDDRVNEELRSAAGISEKGTTSVFESTDAEKDYQIKKYDKKDSHFIRSRLPAKDALRMGAGGLKHKKFRLVMTVFLSLIAFAMFGFADSLAGYQKITGAVDSIADSNVKNASVRLGVRHTVYSGDGNTYVNYYDAMLNDADIAYLNEKTGLDFVPVFTGSVGYGNRGFSVTSQMQRYESNQIYTGKIHGFVDLDAQRLADAGFAITGRLPEVQGEIAITELMYRQFNQYGFVNSAHGESVAAGQLTMGTTGQNSIIGKHVTIDGRNAGMFGSMESADYVIVGVVDTGFNYDRYGAYLPADDSEPSFGEEENMLESMVLAMEIESELNYGFHALGFLKKADIDVIAEATNAGAKELGSYMNGMKSELYLSIKELESEPDGKGEYRGVSLQKVANSSAISSLKITWLDGIDRTSLAANEVILPSRILQDMLPQEIKITVNAEALRAEAERLYGSAAWAAATEAMTEGNFTDYDRLFYAAAWEYVTDTVANAEVVDRIKEYANNRGDTVATAEEARDYWMALFLSDRYVSPPVESNDGTLRAGYEIEEQMRAEILPYLASLCGIALPEGASADDLGTMFQLLLQNGEEKSTVSKWQMIEMLKAIYARADVLQGELWKNESFVELMLGSEHTSGWSDAWDTFLEEDRRNFTIDFYRNFYLSFEEYGFRKNPFGTYSGQQLNQMGEDAFLKASGITYETLFDQWKIELLERDHELGHESVFKTYDFKLVGVYDSTKYMFSDMIVNDTVMADFRAWEEEQWQGMTYREESAEHEDGIWSHVIAPLTGDRALLQTLVEMSYDETGDLQFTLQNPVMDTLNAFNGFIEAGAKVFLYVGIGFAVFASLLLMNFIATSISYKKREIGVLRAVGARSSDVFKIFFSEALIIAAINFVLSTAAVIAAIIVTNTWMHNSGITVTLLHYGIRQFVLMLLVSVGVALLSSFLPVYNIARRKPIDAIRDR